MLLLHQNLPKEIGWQNVLGGLAPDSDKPMPDHTRLMVQSNWKRIEASLGTEFNFDFWTKNQPRRDTYKACRAVIAASYQGEEDRMIEGIQRAYYLRAMNPSDPVILAQIAAELGLDRSRFVKDFESDQTRNELQYQLLLRDKLKVHSFPSLVLEHESVFSRIEHDYQDHNSSLRAINRLLAQQ